MSPESAPRVAPPAEKPPKPEKSQAELRGVLESRLVSLKPVLKDEIAGYKQALEEGRFEDQADEPAGAGETRRVSFDNKITALLDRAEGMKNKLDSKESLPQSQEEIQAHYTHPDNHQETITLNLEVRLQEFLAFYQTTNIELPPNFEDAIREIWNNNQAEIEQAIEQNGFDELLIIPPTPDLGELSNRMKMDNGYYDAIKSSSTVPTLKDIPLQSEHTAQPRIILVHKAQNLKDRPELKATLNTKGKDVKQDQALTLEEYIIFQRKYFQETGKHLDEVGWTWLATKAGTLLIYSNWRPGRRGLYVVAYGLGLQGGDLGVRPTRCFV